MSIEFQYEISKLPKWAQAHIANLQRQRDTAVDALKQYLDNQSPSRIFFEDMLCTKPGPPEYVKVYLHPSRDEVTFNLDRTDKVRENQITVRIDREDPTQVLISAAWNQISIHPNSSNQIVLKGVRP